MKVAPYVLAAAAIIYTGGAALGLALPGMAAGTAATAGFATAVSSGVAAMGLTTAAGGLSTLGAIVAGSVTYAGIGGALGAATSAITGGDISKGLKTGALAGAVVGGAMGAAGYGLPASAMNPTSVAATPGATGAVGSGQGMIQTAAVAPPSGSLAAAPISSSAMPTIGAESAKMMGAAGIPTAAPAVTTVAPAATGGMMSAAPTVAGAGAGGGMLSGGTTAALLASPVIGGLVQGVGTGMAAHAEQVTEREKAAQIAANYGTAGGQGLMTPEQVQGMRAAAPAQPRAADRFAQSPKGAWVYNPGTGRIDFMRGQNA